MPTTVSRAPPARRQAGCGGAYELANRRPGDYYLLALDRSDPAIGGHGFRRAIASCAEEATWEKGAVVILNLRIIPWPLQKPVYRLLALGVRWLRRHNRDANNK